MNLSLFICMFVSMIASTFAGTIEEDFANPPVNTRPYVWWHWMGSNISKEGITKDLEAMKESGIGGATIFNLTSAVQEGGSPTLKCPWPDITYRSPKWWELVKFAAAEAQRLGLEIGMHNCVGYSATGGPWVTPEKSMQKVVWTETAVTGPATFKGVLAQPKATQGFYKDIAVIAVPESATIDPKSIVDLTDKMDAKGSMTWPAPAGAWKLYRFGHTSTGKGPHPIPEDVTALEVDKMDTAASRFHFEQVINPLKENLGPYLGTTFKHLTLDSYEAGGQNWSPIFREEFKKRKGYDPVPWLTAMTLTITGDKSGKTQRIIGDADRTARFEWDYKDVIAQLFQECNFEQGAQIMHEAKLQMQFEAYSGPFSTVSGSALADIPMGEFWTGGGGGINGVIVPSARAAGRRVVAAEALTGQPQISKYTEDPAGLKATADGGFAGGVNRLVLHHWVHQPFGDAFKPGMGMGWWGTHFGRNQTWYEPGKAFYAYLGRCQTLLQRGEGVADYLALDAAAPGADAIDRATLLKGLRVESGQIVLPSGRHYPFFFIPKSESMLPEVARKIKELVNAGAKIACSKPRRSPSMQDWPKCDEEVRQIADEVWGADGTKGEHTYGKGQIQLEGDAGKLLKLLSKSPDCEMARSAGNSVLWTHRHAGATELYYLTNNSPEPKSFTATFRVSSKEPEIWLPEEATHTRAGCWREALGVTEVDLHLEPHQTEFVVFRNPSKGLDPVASITSNGQPVTDVRASVNEQGQTRLGHAAPGKYVLKRASGKEATVTIAAPHDPITIAGPWSVAFSGPDAPAPLEFPALISWSTHEVPAIKYMSGTATYRKEIQLDSGFLVADRLVFLDLGKVMNLAEVTVNGRKLGVSWHPPYRMDITSSLKSGTNTFEIAVTNTWHNRLIGDEQEPEDIVWGKEREHGPYVGRPLLEYPDWFREKKPRPSSGRKCFVTWNYFKKTDPLLEAGLLGPVTLQSESNQTITNSRP